MTVPGGSFPDGTFDDDLSGLDGLNEAAWKNQKLAKLGGFDDMHNALAPAVENASHVPALIDGQSALEDRTDLLDTGYLHLIQSKNWNCPQGGSAKKLPFDRKVGPNKDAIPSNNGIRLLKKGLWRADALLCWQNTTNNGITGDPNFMYTGNVIAVHKVSDNSLFTRKHYYNTVSGTVDPTSMFWSHEFVVPDDNAYDVSVWVAYASSVSPRKLYGGIQYTGLWVTQISHDINDAQPNESVGEGGTLT